MDFFNCYPLGVDHARNHFRLACSDAKHLPKSKKVQERFLKNRIKGNLIYADKVRLLDDADLKWWDKAMPKMTKTPFQGSHMFPFEKPEELAREINGILGVAELN